MLKKIIKYIVMIIVIFISLINTNMIYAYHEYPIYNNDSNEETEKSVPIDEVFDVNPNYLFESIQEITVEEIQDLIKEDKIGNVGLSATTLYIQTTDREIYKCEDTTGNLKSYFILNGYEIQRLTITVNKTEPKKSIGEMTVSEFFNYVIIAVFIIFIIVFVRRMLIENKKSLATSGPGGTDGKFKVKSDGSMIPNVHFSDVEGVEELKSDLIRIVDCLKHPEKYDEIGARVPKGVILYGPPGTGKTLLAKAIAGEADVPFHSAVGSDFVEMYVGVGAKRVRELYKKAKKDAPSIVFIDEIDAVASKRGDDHNSEKDQTINALLAELDGFDSRDRVITICATNRLDMLDSAFKRAGRFDLKLAVGLPDKDGRYHILKLHSANKKLAEDVNLQELASKCSGFSGAELEALLNESAMNAVGNSHKAITNDDIEDAFFKIILQGNKKPRKEITEMNRVIAWHEAGHTLVTKLLTEDKVGSVTIVGSYSGAGGVTFRTPKDEYLHSKKYFESSICIMYAGRAAEELYQGDKDLITDGASQDIKQATSIIKEYLGSYGMGNLGLLDISQISTDYTSIIEDASKMSKELYDKTVNLLNDNIGLLKILAETLLDKETLYENEINEIILENRVNNKYTSP